MFESIKNRWIGLSKASSIVFIILITFLLLAFIYLATWVLKEDYQVLFSDLNPQDASSMIAELERNKTPYRLAENGSSILVESDSVYKTRLKLVGKGLNLNGSVGFELFNNSEFGMTEFAQKVNYLRALQGELERTIMGFEEIKSARVHLVLPETGLFKRKGAEPKASVTVSVKEKAKLTSNQVLGIQKLVAASVPEVTSSEVTIVDQTGVALTKNFAGNEGDGDTFQRLDVKKQLEIYMVQKLIAVLDRVVGPGKAIVSVDVSLNYDQVKITKEDIIPLPHTTGQSVGAITRKRTTRQIDEVDAGQVTTFNEDQSSTIANSPSSASTSEFEYANNRRVEQVLSSPGAINRISVGVVVPNVNDPIKLAKIKEIVAMTSGISIARGDGIVVHDIEIPNFTDEAPEKMYDVNSIEIGQTQTVAKQESGINYKLSLWHYLLLGALSSLLLLYFLISKKEPAKASIAVEDRAKLLDEIKAWATSERSLNQ